ncbi:Bgt-51114 [Blumeria graminis f. sp. tritici]|uniref:Bgt-51114 n=1 Tax=Blumeria graminis f. sp. tritici TaxID=62690 RepID=A0A9X9L7J0_BLUGR|nr:Bgt-51114 [Blumeria graminis f. sp. tritici]
MKIRREWAEAYLNWTYEDWTTVLWTDETWVEDGRNSREWVTRSTSQAYNAD